jgi:hypothetical protein
VTRRLGLTRLFYRVGWRAWSAPARRRGAGTGGLALGVFGPLSLIVLLTLWAACLIAGFGLIQWALRGGVAAPEPVPTLGSCLYFSGVTFFTLGYGDVAPRSSASRAVAVGEAGIGFGFLAIVIGYLPVLYQAFSRREAGITLLDSRAGSPPAAGELLGRYARAGDMPALVRFLADWEVWQSQLLESHLSYAPLSYYRSQHDQESWLSAMAAVLDTCALIMAGASAREPWNRPLAWQAELTYAMARHTAVDLTLVLGLQPASGGADRLRPAESDRLRDGLVAAGMAVHPDLVRRLAALRAEYEPFVGALAEHLVVALPPWVRAAGDADDWQTTAWEQHFAWHGSPARPGPTPNDHSRRAETTNS